MLTRALPTPHISSEILEDPLCAGDQSSINHDGLGCVVRDFLNDYLDHHKEHLPIGQLYALVMGEVEKPLLATTLNLCEGNQKKASEILGINRNTLRRKMIEYQLESENA
jgi:DNA-binding protein Fis